MSRAVHVALLLGLLLVLAGCQTPGSPAPEATPGPDGLGENGAAVGAPGSNGSAGTSTGDGADPDGQIGWEDGYWHDDSIDVNADNGLNETELEIVVSRSMARVEYLRGMEFEERVSVEVINRSTFSSQSGGSHNESLQRFDNGKFEAMFLVGNQRDSIETQDETLSQSVLGYYSPSQNAIVIVSDSPTPMLEDELTLGHELLHALQDQHFDLSDHDAQTRDAYQGRNGLVEGDAVAIERQYEQRCGDEWECLSVEHDDDGQASGGGSVHFGIQFLLYFPYSDGPGFVDYLYNRGGWAAVDAAYDDVPQSSTEIIHPERYGEWEPADVEVEDRSTDEWERVQPPNRPDYAVLGQSAIASSLAYTLADDYNRSSVVAPTDVINYRPDGSLNPHDPYRYDVDAADGWEGGKLYVYHDVSATNGGASSAEPGEDSAYVWQTQWENAGEAEEFATTWTHLVDHWGGDRVSEHRWVITDSEFAGAYHVEQDGDTVTVVNAPTRADLDAVHAT